MDYNRYDAMLSNHKQITEEGWFAGGIWGWRGMIPYNTYTVNTMTPALDACEKNGTENIIMCLWGDDGNECSRYFELPLGRVELAEYLCVNRSALTRELVKMKEDGLIDYDKNTFRML
jgi:CRP-like cAMP-binding protein